MSMLQNMKIGKRLGIGFGILVLLLLGMTGAALWGGASQGRATDDILAEGKISMLAAGASEDVRDIGLKIALMFMHEEKEEREQLQKALGAVRESYKKRVDELKAMDTTPTGRALIDKLEKTIGDARDANNKSVELALAGKDAEGKKIYSDQSSKLMEKVYATAREILDWRQERLKELDAQANALETTIRWVLIVGGGLAVVLAIVFGVVLTRGIVRPVREGVDFAAAMAGGDMTKTLAIAQKDEIGELAKALNDMGASMRRMIADVSGGVQTLASSSTELSSISGHMASSVRSMSEKAGTVAAAAEESSANTTSVAASMEQMTANLTSVAGATEQMSATVGEIGRASCRERV